jgi:hypothetical protein
VGHAPRQNCAPEKSQKRKKHRGLDLWLLSTPCQLLLWQ